MSFERTKGSITNLSGGNVSAESMLDMMVCVARDAYELTGVTNAAALPVQDQATLLKKMYNLVKMMLSIYDGNKEGVSQFSERIQSDYKAAMELLGTQESVLEKLVKDTDQQEQNLTRLQATAQKVEKSRGHLLKLQEQCEELQKRIDLLNDPALNQLPDKVKALRDELAERQARVIEFREMIAKLEAERDEAEKLVATQGEAARKVQDRLIFLRKEEKELTDRKSELEADVVETQEKLEAMRKGIEELPALRDKINEAYQEIRVQMTAMTNAVNSARSDAFLEANLYAKEAGGALTVENYPDLEVAGKQVQSWEELEGWFSQLEARINGLMQVYCQTLSTVVQKAETITVKKDQE